MRKTASAKVFVRSTEFKTVSASIALLISCGASAADDSLGNKELQQTDSVVIYGKKPALPSHRRDGPKPGLKSLSGALPRSKQTIPERLIIEQNPRALSDVLTNAAGLTRANRPGGGGKKTKFSIRGVTNRYLMLDGQPVSSSLEIDVANIERVEVELGATSILNGKVSPGGLVNVVTKQPRDESANSVRAELDEHGKRKMTFDSTGPLSDTLQYRLVVTGEDSKKLRISPTEDETYSKQQSYNVAPVFRYAPDAENSYLLRLNQAEQRRPDQGTVASKGTDKPLLPPRDEYQSIERGGQFGWQRKLHRGWSNSLKVGYYDKVIIDYLSPQSLGPGGPPASGGTFTAQDIDESGLFISDTLSGDYRLAGLNHTLSIGASHFDRVLESESDTHRTDEFGLSIQNLARLTGQLNLLTGLRYDQLQSSDSSGKRVDDDISAQLGLHYRLSRTLSVYGSYSESFLPNYPEIPVGVVIGEPLLAPEQARQYELGIKSQLLNGRLDLTAAVYRLNRNNVKTFNNRNVRLNAQEQSHGLDLYASLRLMPGWNARANYSYIDSEIIDDNDPLMATEGNRPFNLPEHKARIWSAYEFQGGTLDGIGFGLGAQLVSDRFIDNQNTESVPGYAIFDTAVWYRLRVGQDKRLRLQAGIRNLTDIDYIKTEANDRPFKYKVGDPRTVYITASMTF